MWLLLLAGCGDEPACTDACSIPDGDYSIVVPTGDGPFPVVFRLHGLNGTGSELAEGQAALKAEAEARGALLVFPDGVDGKWNHNQRADERDDVAFFQRILDEVASEHPVDRQRVALSGHSVGGTMVWTVACEAPQGFSAFYASSGGPFRPLQEACSGQAVSLVHTHGLADQRVELDERTFDAIGFLSEEGQCDAGVEVEDGPLTCTIYGGCRDGNEVRLCTHDGGHADAAGWQGRLFGFFAGRWGE